MTHVAFSRTFIATLAVTLVLGAACGDDNDSTSPEGSSAVTASFTGLQPLEEDLNYQLWAITESGGYYYGYGVAMFDVNGSGQMVDPAAETVISGDFTVGLAAENIYGFAVSIELSDELVGSSSYTILIGGETSDNQTTLSTGSWLGLEIDPAEISGKYTLATPTDSVSGNEINGIWFLDVSSGLSFDGLALPDLGSGWEYQGWVLVDGKYISTGKFSAADEADDDNPYSGSYSSPAFPGEDFLNESPSGFTFPLDLRGATVIVTIEPWDEYDTDEGTPFYLRVLEADISAAATDHQTYFMNTVTGSLPTGSVMILE